jgi:hypothetical protein
MFCLYIPACCSKGPGCCILQKTWWSSTLWGFISTRRDTYLCSIWYLLFLEGFWHFGTQRDQSCNVQNQTSNIGDNFFKSATYTIEAVCASKEFNESKERLKEVEAEMLRKRNLLREFETEYKEVKFFFLPKENFVSLNLKILPICWIWFMFIIKSECMWAGASTFHCCHNPLCKRKTGGMT